VHTIWNCELNTKSIAGCSCT